MGKVAASSPVNGIVEIAGPEQFRLDDLIRQGPSAHQDPRKIVADPHARYCGAELGERTLPPGEDVRLARTRFPDWLELNLTATPR